jgi:phage terminase large subunit
MQLLILVCTYAKNKILVSVVSESTPHLRRGCIRDFMSIMGSSFDDSRYNKTEHIYRFAKAEMEFFPADNSSKMRGGRRDILFINECNNVSKTAFDELDVRTKRITFLDYNPVADFWGTELIGTPNSEYIHSTYLDAKHVLPKATIDSIESRKDRDPNWWRVYGLGEVGKIEGLVHPTFTTCKEMPEGGERFYGLDFGFSSDPTALVLCVLKDDTLYCDQLIYESGLTNDSIARRMESVGVKKHYDEIFADSAEPKSIREIGLHGFNIRPAPKGSDSVNAGIQKINQYKQVWTERSIDAIKEQRNYRYIETSDGKITEKPMDDFNHAMDARRYAVFTKKHYAPARARMVAI